MSTLHEVEADLNDGAAGWLAPELARLEALLGSHAAFEEYLLTRAERQAQG